MAEQALLQSSNDRGQVEAAQWQWRLACETDAVTGSYRDRTCLIAQDCPTDRLEEEQIRDLASALPVTVIARCRTRPTPR